MTDTDRGFRAYMHIERLGNEEVDGIEDGTVLVFPKIDGTNSSIWVHNGVTYAGSRKRVLTVGSDNAGFNAWVFGDDPAATACRSLVQSNGVRLYGEWLVPHTFKGYRDDAWRRFWVFDVAVDRTREKDHERSVEFLSYDEYQPMLEAYGVDYISPLKVVTNGTREDFDTLLEQNHFLLPDGDGVGEGIVLKRYGYENLYGRTTWAKIVRQAFKEAHVREMGAPRLERASLVEASIVDATVTRELVEKTMAKIALQRDATGWRSEFIPQLLGTMFHEVVVEELWEQLKKHRNPVIDFKRLQREVVKATRLAVPDVF